MFFKRIVSEETNQSKGADLKAFVLKIKEILIIWENQ